MFPDLKNFVMDIQIEELNGAGIANAAEELGEMLVAVIDSGVSNHFVYPFARKDAQTVFRAYIPDTGTTSFTWVARGRANSLADTKSVSDSRLVIAGTVTLGFHKSPGGFHRAEVRKLIVHPSFQRRGIARKLMSALEQRAREHDKTLLLLDTTAGYHGEKLYKSMGWEMIGICPGYASSTDKTRFEDAAFMYKDLKSAIQC